MDAAMEARWVIPDYRGVEITISVVWEIVKSIFKVPGDGLIYLLYRWEGVGRFLELGPADYGTTFSLIASGILWYVIIAGVLLMISGR